MPLLFRSILVLGLLAAGTAGHYGLFGYLEAAGPLPVVELRRPLDELPRTLGPWQGQDRPIEDEALLYADAHLDRMYRHMPTGHTVQVWMAYSRTGEDRGHHPEICMAVAGKPEDPQARKTLPLPGKGAPIQRYRFGRPGEFQLVYYWYYTMKPPRAAGVSDLQRLYQRLRARPASVTIEVFSPEGLPEHRELAEDLVARLDAAVQELVGPEAVRGSRRSPVTHVEGTAGTEANP
jgi:EpsI family protein